MHQAVVSSLCGGFNMVSGDARAGMFKEIENSSITLQEIESGMLKHSCRVEWTKQYGRSNRKNTIVESGTHEILTSITSLWIAETARSIYLRLNTREHWSPASISPVLSSAARSARIETDREIKTTNAANNNNNNNAWQPRQTSSWISCTG